MEILSPPRLHKDWIDPHALGIVKALQKGGFTTYLVGGCVRDLLLGGHPKDYDIATAAHPPQVKRLIYMAFIIGKRFRLVLVKRDQQQFEVATFRCLVDSAEPIEGLAESDNVFGTPEEDAQRRDFTVNGLFYDPVASQLIDYVNGMDDIEHRVLRMIGDPNVRLIEDPIRILRALRLSHKLGFRIDSDLRAAIAVHSVELEKAVLPRRREEILKILRLKNPDLALLEAFDLGILRATIPSLHELFQDPVKLEVFFEHFRLFHPMAPDYADTVHLFGWLIFSYFRTVVETTDDDGNQNILNEERFQTIMRDELGLFKFEQLTISRALQVARLLGRAEEFKKRGERRKFALLRNEGFALALNMAEVDYQFSPEILQFWKDSYTQALPQLQTQEPRARTRPRRNPRRRKPRSGVGAEAGAGGSTETESLPSPEPAGET